jgi:hypothetical protein
MIFSLIVKVSCKTLRKKNSVITSPVVFEATLYLIYNQIKFSCFDDLTLVVNRGKPLSYFVAYIINIIFTKYKKICICLLELLVLNYFVAVTLFAYNLPCQGKLKEDHK